MISSSAPPKFRAKQRSPVKPQQATPPGNPMRGNQHPMMRSETTMGGKTPNMVPRAGISSFAAPPPRGRMMADGGFGDPGMIGGAPAQQPPPPAMDPDQDGDMDMPVIKPESVNYHDDPHACSGCQYMGQDGQCAVLKMMVSPDGGCTAFEPKGQEESPEGAGAEQPGEDAGGDENGGY